MGDEAYLKYKKQRQDGYFDTKIRVNTTTSYFEQQIKDGGTDGEKENA
jgi:hypothetical protein